MSSRETDRNRLDLIWAGRYAVVEGKTPQIQREQADTLLRSIQTPYEVES